MPDAACRVIDDAHEGFLVQGVYGQSQIGDDVLDFLALEECQVAVDAIGYAKRAEGFLERSALCVGAEEDGHVVVAEPLLV